MAHVPFERVLSDGLFYFIVELPFEIRHLRLDALPDFSQRALKRNAKAHSEVDLSGLEILCWLDFFNCSFSGSSCSMLGAKHPN